MSVREKELAFRPAYASLQHMSSYLFLYIWSVHLSSVVVIGHLHVCQFISDTGDQWVGGW
jgi:hypothetical protein